MKQTRRDFVRTLFVASQAAVASRFLPVNLLADGAPQNTLNFLVFGDWGRQGELDQREVAEQMGIAARNIGARFVIAVGDNFYEDGVKSLSDDHWKKSFEDVYTASSLQVPWHVILGNHDYHGNCDAQLAYARTSSRWTMPARYYKQTHQIDDQTTADFFYLDTTPMIKIYHRHGFEEGGIRANVIAQDVPRQLAWFKAGLAASRAQWKVVFAHHPIYSGGEHGDQAELIQQILPLLREYNVHAYFNGHDHDLQHLVTGDVNLFCSGAGSSVRPTKTIQYTRFAKSRSGFTTVNLGPDTMDVSMTDWRGTVIYTTTVARSVSAVGA